MLFSKLGLGQKITRALEENHYTEPSPIQVQAIPIIAAGHDVIACAQTGTGKTAAFSLPLIERIANSGNTWRQTTVLILSPTRELASQIVENIKKYSKYLPIRCEAVYGGVNMSSQIRNIRKGVHIIVATPGRLLDHLQRRTVDLSNIETLVLDEADRMLDMGFIREVKRIFTFLPRSGRQNLLFSATFSPEIKALTKEILHRPKIIQIAKENTPVETINQVVHPVDRKRRRELLSHLIGKENWKQVLVFTRTKRGANQLAEKLNTDGHKTMAIHGNKSQGARALALDSFKKGKVHVLVATDIAARGIDIHDLPQVVNFDLPQVPENYVHRIGRTGRAGKKGKAISLFSIDETRLLRSIELLLGKNLPKEVVPDFEPDPSILYKPTTQKNKSQKKKLPGKQANHHRKKTNRNTTKRSVAKHRSRS